MSEHRSSEPSARARIVHHARGFAADLAEMAGARFELLTLDAKEFAVRIVYAVIAAALLGALALIALAALLAAVLFAVGVEHGLTVSLVALALAIAAGIGVFVWLRSQFDPTPRFFAATLDEFKRDAASLDSRE